MVSSNFKYQNGHNQRHLIYNINNNIIVMIMIIIVIDESSNCSWKKKKNKKKRKLAKTPMRDLSILHGEHSKRRDDTVSGGFGHQRRCGVDPVDLRLDLRPLREPSFDPRPRLGVGLP